MAVFQIAFEAKRKIAKVSAEETARKKIKESLQFVAKLLRRDRVRNKKSLTSQGTREQIFDEYSFQPAKRENSVPQAEETHETQTSV